MMTSQLDRNILLGVSGGVAAYKSADLCRRLLERGARLRVIMTRGAQAFVTPLTFQALSGNPVHTELLDERAEAGMGHIELARWADLILIAPASANTIARLSAGLADDLLSTVCLASSAPLMIAPAMNKQMWAAAATGENVARLRGRGVELIGPGFGDQACGDVGAGRMLEPTEIADALVAAMAGASALAFAEGSRSLHGVAVLITAGPTREAIDPVRFISNHSSGKMGYAIARAAACLGAEVTLVSGPTALSAPGGVERVMVESSADMHAAVMGRIDTQKIFIAAAAVADYRPAQVADQKIKKSSAASRLDLVRTEDILADVAAMSRPPFTVGFAAETTNVHEHARGKLMSKKLHMIAANQVGLSGQGFNSDDNALTVLWADGSREFELQSKAQLASHLMDLVAERYRANSTTENS
ncbi:MAG: phosphopantothenoylcysteine decarboxylase/phosphopantothenate--cysteine ligase [Gammaproteobacteria bacterium]|jgi:phosphopantothenoylcysteine decarboxylase/phosphopantothenate--cysteine ligase